MNRLFSRFYFPFLMSVALLGACSDSLPSEPPACGEAEYCIDFNPAETHMANSDDAPTTRSFDATSFETFYVYGGYWSGSNPWALTYHQVFDGRRVDRYSTGQWDYDGHERWEEGETYKFYAIGIEGDRLPSGVTTHGFYIYDEVSGVGKMHYPLVISNLQVDDAFQGDIVYASTPEIVAQREGFNSIVQLQFRHILSRLEFVFSNASSEAVTLSDLRLEHFFSISSYEYYASGGGLSWSPWPLADSRRTARLTLRFDGRTEATLAPDEKLVSDEGFVIPFDYNSAYATGMGYAYDVALSFTVGYASGRRATQVITMRPLWEEGKSYKYSVQL